MKKTHLLILCCLAAFLAVSVTHAEAGPKKKVRALTIGIKEHYERPQPDDLDYIRFDYYSRHWPKYDDWYMCFIVVNYENKPVPCTIRMKMKGPSKKYIKRKAVLQPNQATMFVEKVKLANRPGLYTIEGSISGKDIKWGRKVRNRFYIYEIW